VPNPTMLPARSQQIPRSIRSAASSMVAFSQPANPARLPTPEPDGRPPQRCAVEAQGVPAKTAHLGSSPIKVGARAERGTREARADSRASYFNHKWPPESEEADKHPRPAGGFLRHAGDVLSLIGIEDDAARRRRRCKREKIRQWSAASRTRLLRVCLALDWDLVGALCMVTLTYPGDRGAAFIARDGITVHRHLRRFLKRWTRRWGKPKGLWKLEFQDRGAPHLHVFLSMPCDVSITLLRSWVADNWWEIVGSGDTDHLLAGTAVDPWTGTPTRYAWKYAKADPSKERQHQVPESFKDVGRWWGLINVAPKWTTIVLPMEKFVRARRLLRRWSRARRGYRPRLRSSAAGLWLYMRRPVVLAVVSAVLRATAVS